jgi:hypothetical protein
MGCVVSEPLYSGGAILRGRGESDKAGRWIRLEIEDEGAAHPFKGYENERFAIVVVPIGNDEQPIRIEKRSVPKRARGGHARAATLSPEQRSEAAQHAAIARWHDEEAGELASDGPKAVADASPPATKSPRKMPPSSRAALLCKEPEFWAYLSAMAMDGEGRAPGYDALTAEAELKTRLGVERKSHILEGSRAAAELSRVVGNYHAWLTAKGHGVV